MDRKQSGRRLQLHYRNEEGIETSIGITTVPFTVGRSPSSDLRLAFSGVSRIHARFVTGPNSGWAVEDTGSANGTFLNGIRVRSSEPLSDGDVISVGSASLRVDFLGRSTANGGTRQVITRSVGDLRSQWAALQGEATVVQSPTVARLQDLVEIAKELNLAVSIDAIFDRAREVVFRYLRDVERLARFLVDSDDAVTKLVSYDYTVGNVRELESAVCRAAILADGDRIESEAIFLGPPPSPPTGFNWLSLRPPGRELWLNPLASPEAGRLVVVFLGLPAAMCLILLIALHRCSLGCLMLFAPEFMLSVFGFEPRSQLFFVSQGGIFLLVFGVCYGAACWKPQLLIVVLVSKGFAVVFLVAEAGLLGAPPSVWLAAGDDTTMLAVLLLGLVLQSRK